MTNNLNPETIRRSVDYVLQQAAQEQALSHRTADELVAVLEKADISTVTGFVTVAMFAAKLIAIHCEAVERIALQAGRATGPLSAEIMEATFTALTHHFVRSFREKRRSATAH